MEKEESRASTRVDLEVEVSYESEHNFYTGFTQNISGGGLFVATPVVAPIGSKLSVRFSLATAPEPIEAEAIVRWVRELGEDTGMGIQFVDLSEAARRAIDEFISRRDTIFFDHDE